VIRNYLTTGTLATVSAAAKSDFTLGGLLRAVPHLWKQFVPRVTAVTGIPKARCSRCWSSRSCCRWHWRSTAAARFGTRWPSAPEFYLFVAAHFIFLCFAAPLELPYSHWYFMPEILAAAMVLPRLNAFEAPSGRAWCRPCAWARS